MTIVQEGLFGPDVARPLTYEERVKLTMVSLTDEFTSDGVPVGPLILNWGGGVNSTALAVGMHERGIRPDLVIWADTGGEKPGTYAYVAIFQEWLARVGFPPLVTVRKDGPTLEEYCLDRMELPAIAYGIKSCSDHWKRRPVHTYVKTWAPAVEAWAAGRPCRKALGFDWGETRRMREDSDRRYVGTFPLVDWQWDRYDCIDAIKRAGLPMPPKSACFFCPNSKKAEVRQLAVDHPELAERAIAMEVHAKKNPDPLRTIKGLGRSWNWGEVIRASEDQLDALVGVEIPPQACFCDDEEYDSLDRDIYGRR